MVRRFYTVMIVPHEGGSLRRLSVSRNFVLSMSAIFLFCFLSSAFLAHFFLDGVNPVDQSEQLRVEADRLELENSHVHSALYRTVLKLEELTARLEEYAEVHEWTANDFAVGGADVVDANLELSQQSIDADWRGMASAAQDKAAFWARLFEQQICDRTSYVRSLPTVWPVSQGSLTSGYHYRRDPFTGQRRFHHGIDIGAPRGTPVLAAGDGVVVEARRRGGYGNCVVIDHGNGLQSLYAHLNRMRVEEGEIVSRADVIGEVGSTGRAKGAHLHLEIVENDRRVNPLDHYLSRPGRARGRPPRGT